MVNAMMTHTAPRPHLQSMSASDAATVARCIVRVLADSDRTQDIMTAEEITAQAQLRYLLDRGVMDTPEGRDLTRDKPDFADLDMAALRQLPAGSLGGALARFHEENNLKSDIYMVPASYTPDPEAAFLMQRLRHAHDVWHVLTGLGVQGHEEILLHAFSLAQTGLPSSIALMALGSVKHMLLEGRLRTFVFGMRRAYDHGRRATSLLPVYWERHWETPVEEIRARYGVVPLS